ncbi:MAG: hypothetical protein NTW03_14865, partial [Verrucomicrobia bacterium]|nr:hypothetical protein [Verrucomicrobiota bacterium]
MKIVKAMSRVACGMVLASTVGGAEPASSKETGALNWQFGYDDEGRITKLVDPGGKATQLQYSFDEQKRLRKLTREHADGAKVVHEFDDRGRRVKTTDSLGVVRYDYDDFNRLTGVRREGQPAITYGYDTVDRVTSIGVGEQFTTRYEYDFLGRLAAIDSPAGKVTYEYRAGQGKVIRTLPNGIWTVWEYGPDGSLKSLTHVAKDNKVILKFEYAYRPDGLIQEIKEWSPEGEKIVAYEYDKAQRLITVSDSKAGTTRYAYDPLGNRTALTGPDGKTVASEYDWAGRLLKHDGQECAHDNAGNLTSYAGPQGPLACQYDAANRLKAVTTEKGRVEYQHDGQRLLITRVAEGKKTRFVLDAISKIWRPILAIDNDNEETFYLWEGERALADFTHSQFRFFLEDHLGSVRFIADGQSHIVKQISYSAFGETQSIVGAEPQPGFAGLFYDSYAGMYLASARGYAPYLARFLQADPKQRIPLFSPKDTACYAYCGGDPLNFMDLDGAEPSRVWHDVNAWLDTHVEWLPKWRTMTTSEQFGDFTGALTSGRLVGTRLGENGAQWYAQRQLETGNWLYAIPGSIASLWTKETFAPTTLTLAGGWAVSGWAAATGPTVGEAWVATSRAAG